MRLEDKIAKIIKDEYSPDGYEDEGRSTAAAHDIMMLLVELGEGRKQQEERMAMDPKFKFELGDRVKDIITSFSGIVYGRIEWFNGCHRYMIIAEKIDEKGKPIEVTVDSEQLQIIEPSAVRPPVREGARTGGPFPDVHQREI